MTENNGTNPNPNPNPMPGIGAGPPEPPSAPSPPSGAPVPPPFAPPPPPYPGYQYYPGANPPPPKEKHSFTRPEIILFFLSLLLGFLYDRLVLSVLAENHSPMYLTAGLFWILYLAVLYAWKWETLRANAPLWLMSALAVALCLWNVIFDYRSNYGSVTLLVIPGVVMAITVFSCGKYSFRDVWAVTLEWLLGWIVKPLSAIPHFFGAAHSLGSRSKNSAWKKVLAGLALSVPLLLVLVPLLSGADMVFAHFLAKLVEDFRIGSLIGHLILIFLAAMLFFSLLWNSRFAQAKAMVPGKVPTVDALICGIVLGMVLVVYALFCGVQFTYLFAGTGLPADISYSEYAREGFWQLIIVASINLALFGAVYRFSARSRVLAAMQVLLLACTGVMLASGAVRLKLYTDTFGLTWLRLLSAWFILYLGVVLLLSLSKLAWKELPLLAVAAFLLMAWYVLLGYANPDALIVRYNLGHSPSGAEWVADNGRYIRSELSDDAFLVLEERGLTGYGDEILEHRRTRASRGHSLSSRRLAEIIREKYPPLPEEEEELLPQ